MEQNRNRSNINSSNMMQFRINYERARAAIGNPDETRREKTSRGPK